MRDLLTGLLRFFASLQLTVVLLVFSIMLVFVATLDQVNLGIWAVQEKYFRSFFVYWPVPGSTLSFPVFPGGYLVGGFLFANLIVAQFYRFTFTWRKIGLVLAHSGLVLLLVGELLAGLWQEDFQLRLDQGETKNFSESSRLYELAIIDTTDPKWDDVVAIPEAMLAAKTAVQHPKLPFRIAIKDYYPNATLEMRRENTEGAPSPATAGFGPRLVATPLPPTYREDERNMPAAFAELIGPDGTLGTYLVTPMLVMPQTFSVGARNFSLIMRPARAYKPFSLTLLELRHDVYPGSEIPKNFSSRVRLQSADGKDNREVLIYMNNPLRAGGYTFYQYQMNEQSRFSVLQVVRNPSWLLPYISCTIISIGLLFQFGISLAAFIAQRRTPANAPAA
ncbi:MAG: cytochrome c biogenesis protein ResB [Opitutae bacterium]|nr:cytochrome c biogenesis protein ResB [Opitutae bacterium]